MRLAPLALVLATAATAHAAPLAWSKTEQGVHARLIVESTTDAQKHAQIAVSVEIENVGDVAGGLPLPWGDITEMLTFTIEDANGKVVAGEAPGGNRLSPLPYIVPLPEHSTLRVSVTPSAIEYVPGGKTLFRPVTFQAWELPAKHGPLFVRATLTPHAQEKGAKAQPRSWSVPLELPRVALP
ncbi:MAG TPA: hypothetical protein VGM90_13480 [Kofleriaceae bacterium]|jgi:hypothetical protein